MNRIRRAAFALFALIALGLASHDEFNHFYRYGHFAPLSLHVDVVVTTSNELLGVDGAGKIYEATLTNYGVRPTTIVVCDYLNYASMHAIMLNYVVERGEPSSNRWVYVPEWDEFGSRLFCRPSFEVTATHRVRRRLWPGQKIEVGGGIPAQMGGFRVGDDGRFTVFLQADGNGLDAVSSAAFHVDQEPKKQGAKPLPPSASPAPPAARETDQSQSPNTPHPQSQAPPSSPARATPRCRPRSPSSAHSPVAIAN